jgi:hypothetical protein
MSCMKLATVLPMTAGALFVVWCGIVIALPVLKVSSGKLEMNGDLLAIIILHLVLGTGTVVALKRAFARGRARG